MTLSKKAFLAATLLVVAVLSSSVVAYAEVTVDGAAAPLQGSVVYSLNNAEAVTWSTTLAPACPSAPWYSRLEIGAGYSGAVTVTWKLEQKTDAFTWIDVSAVSTSMVLSGNGQTIYATSDGAYSQSNYDWGQNITASGTYRVVASIMT
jgi:hypothetical protein